MIPARSVATDHAAQNFCLYDPLADPVHANLWPTPRFRLPRPVIPRFPAEDCPFGGLCQEDPAATAHSTTVL